MSKYEASEYGEAVGNNYDTLYPNGAGDAAMAVGRLAELAMSAPERSVLEFGIGTGRLAIPLLQCGITVSGIDGSERMVRTLHSKPYGSDIDVLIADYRDGRIENRRFGLVLLAFNGIFDERGIQAQLDIFRNAARHLCPGGLFVIESWVMTESQRNGSWSVMPRYVGDQHVELQMARYNIDRNSIERTLVHLLPDGIRFISVSDTYASPGELDVMATVTGFRRVARYARWDGAEFTVASTGCISVYQHACD